MSSFIYLASQSPRRSQLLAQIQIQHTLLLANVPNDMAEDAEAFEAVVDGEDPAQYVQRVTQLKLQAAVARWQRRKLPQAPILCADTTVALGQKILGKPQDALEAATMLEQLSGATHHVFTAVAVAAGDAFYAGLSVSQVRLMKLTPDQIKAYVATQEPMGKAGAYGVQGMAAAWIDSITGSYSGIMGLPLFETAQLLHQAGCPVSVL